MESMKKIEGLGVSSGIGIGTVLLLEKIELEIPVNAAESAEVELERFELARKAVAEETMAMIEKARKTGENSKADILDAYLMLIDDPAVTEGTRELIKEELKNAVMATQLGVGAVAELFEAMVDDEYMQERAFDIRDIQQRIMMSLLGVHKKDLSILKPDTIVVADDLTTSDTAQLDFSNLAGMITSVGGQNSHASIMARNFEIPAIAGAKTALTTVKDGEKIVLDGFSGVAFTCPTNEILTEYISRRESYLAEKVRLEKYRALPSVTADGHHVEICANIGTPVEVQRALESTSDGIGLLRSEFLYMNSGTLPNEDVQFDAYKAVVMGLAPKPVIVRTMDIGGDKELPSMHLEREENPFLGYRAIRICLDRPELFNIQLRALLRASQYGNLKIMFPMISCMEELLAAKQAVEAAKQELRKEGLAFNENVPLGIMIEIPSAAVMSLELAKECDFFSIGTNDLIQYTTAVDRGNERISKLYSAYHPAVLRLIAHTIKSAHAVGIPCGMCGEAAGDPLLIPALFGMGLDEFSMSAGMVLRAREILSKLTLPEAKKIADVVVAQHTQEMVCEVLRKGQA